ncbi:MAG: hypothetical protein JWR80_7487 [Bradyrhizobium sp.]|nr:hypothetical protein [Bradyrhizobium sp.]
MLYHFSIYCSGTSDAQTGEFNSSDDARDRAIDLLKQATHGCGPDDARGDQVRVVVSDDAGTDLFTIACVATRIAAQMVQPMNPEPRPAMQ